MPKTKNRCDEIKDERRQQILNCALELFCENGVSATKIDDIAKMAEISHGLFYHYFKTKDEIFIELFFDGHKHYSEFADWILSHSNLPAKEKFIVLTDRMLETIANDKNVGLHLCLRQNLKLIKKDYEEVLTKALTEPGRDHKAYKDRAQQMKVFEDLFIEGQNDGDFLDGDPKELLHFYWTIINGITLDKLRSTKLKLPPKPIHRELVLRAFLKNTENL